MGLLITVHADVGIVTVATAAAEKEAASLKNMGSPILCNK